MTITAPDSFIEAADTYYAALQEEYNASLNFFDAMIRFHKLARRKKLGDSGVAEDTLKSARNEVSDAKDAMRDAMLDAEEAESVAHRALWDFANGSEED